MKTALALACLVMLGAQAHKQHCKRYQDCWPSQSELNTLRLALDPTMERLLQNVAGEPYSMAYPPSVDGLSDEENGQPLFGLGLSQMEPLYVRTNLTTTCEEAMTFNTPYCKAQATNKWENAEPDFVVFPLTVAHVQTSLAFAKCHNLCVVVAGTGHEFYGRNQPLHCDGGSILIRTTLMKSKETDFDDDAGLGHPSFRVGAGNVFSELHHFAASHGKMVASGMCPTVGIVGWSMGGGHGVFGPWLGLGVDQVLAFDVVLASGAHVRVAPDTQYADLFKAMRGGGGSTWGIVTHVVIKAHDIPADGLTMVIGLYMGSNETDGWKHFANVTHLYAGVAPANLTTTYAMIASSGSITGLARSISPGGANTPEVQGFLAMLAEAGTMMQVVLPFTNSYDMWSKSVPVPLTDDPVAPWSDFAKTNSVLFDRDDIPTYISYLESVLPGCASCMEAFVSDFSGHIGSPQPTEDLTLSTEMRTTVGMYMTLTQPQSLLEQWFGTGRTYFSESNGDLPMSRLWSWSMYLELVQTKNKYDPNGIFGCRRCVGDDTYFSV